MKDLVQVDDNNNNKIDLNLMKNGLTNGSSAGAIVKATVNGYAAVAERNGSKCTTCDKGEWLKLYYLYVSHDLLYNCSAARHLKCC